MRICSCFYLYSRLFTVTEENVYLELPNAEKYVNGSVIRTIKIRVLGVVRPMDSISVLGKMKRHIRYLSYLQENAGASSNHQSVFILIACPVFVSRSLVAIGHERC